MTASEFDQRFAVKVKSERKITNELLSEINRTDSKGFHLELGFSSLFDWLTRGHGYSHGAAQRRVQAARLLKVVPGISEKLESGKTTLCTIAEVQSALYQSEKLGRKISAEEKAEVVEQIQNKNGIEAKQTLMTFFPELENAPQCDWRRAVSHDRTRVTCEIDNETSKKLDRVKELISHKCPDGSMNDILNHLCDYFLNREDLLRKSAKKKKTITKTITPCTKPQAAIPSAAKRITLQRSNDQCEYYDPISGRRCNSRYQTQTDHIKMRAHGGDHSTENLRRLCRVHNKFMAEKKLGEKWANHWRKEKPEAQ